MGLHIIVRLSQYYGQFHVILDLREIFISNLIFEIFVYLSFKKTRFEVVFLHSP